MARAQGDKHYFTFTAGLITEASPLNFPENASLDEENFELLITGERKRRKGIDFETPVEYTTQTILNTDAVSTHRWDTAALDSDSNFVVAQIGSGIFFYNNSISFTKKSFSIDLTSYKTSTATNSQVATSRVDMASGKGYLFIVGRYIEPLYVSYDTSGDSITVNQITLLERDRLGVDDSLEVADNPTTLSDEHAYNLINQGWWNGAISSYRSTIGDYPSNAEIPWTGYYVNPSNGQEVWDANEVVRNSQGSNSTAPRGHYVRNVFDTSQTFSLDNVIDIDSISYAHGSPGTVTITTVVSHGLSTGNSVEITNSSINADTTSSPGCPATDYDLDGTYTITVTGPTSFTFTYTITDYNSTCSDTEGEVIIGQASAPSPRIIDSRPEAVAFYAGRAWYAGINDTDIGAHIYYSQIVEKDDDIGECYQNADPTSRNDYELVATDGGYVVIPEIGSVIKMAVSGAALIIIASNGVWQITGGESEQFLPTSYTIRKITNVGGVSASSVIEVEGAIFYASKQGIYKIAPDQVTALPTSTSVTFTTIQTLYEQIPDVDKAIIAGVYDDLNKKIIWLYNDSSNGYYRYSKALILDLRLAAFYKYVFQDAAATIIGLATSISQDSYDKKTKFLTDVDSTKATWSSLTNTDFLDWYTEDSTGVDAAAYLITGYDTAGVPNKNKEATYIWCYFNRTEENWVDTSALYDYPSSCYMQARWSWSDGGQSGKFGTSQQVYRIRRPFLGGTSADDGMPVVITKNKIRGTGKELHLKFSTEAGKDCQLLGWSINYTVEEKG